MDTSELSTGRVAWTRPPAAINVGKTAVPVVAMARAVAVGLAASIAGAKIGLTVDQTLLFAGLLVGAVAVVTPRRRRPLVEQGPCVDAKTLRRGDWFLDGSWWLQVDRVEAADRTAGRPYVDIFLVAGGHLRVPADSSFTSGKPAVYRRLADSGSL